MDARPRGARRRGAKRRMMDAKPKRRATATRLRGGEDAKPNGVRSPRAARRAEARGCPRMPGVTIWNGQQRPVTVLVTGLLFGVRPF